MSRSPIPKLLYQKIFVAVVHDIVINILVRGLEKVIFIQSSLYLDTKDSFGSRCFRNHDYVGRYEFTKTNQAK